MPMPTGARASPNAVVMVTPATVAAEPASPVVATPVTAAPATPKTVPMILVAFTAKSSCWACVLAPRDEILKIPSQVSGSPRLCFLYMNNSTLRECGGRVRVPAPGVACASEALEVGPVELVECFPVPGVRFGVVGRVIGHRESVVGGVELEGVVDSGVSERALQ